jgi:hypothetical protein
MIYEMVLRGTVKGQASINRFTYVSQGETSGVLGSYALADAFGLIGSGNPTTYPTDKPMHAILNVLSSSYSLSNITIRAVADYDPLDFYEVAYASPRLGTGGADVLHPALCFGLRTNVVRTDIRRATKRFSGVPVNAVTDGGTVVTGWKVYLDSLASRLGEVLVFDGAGGSLSFSPCVVHKQEYTTPRGNRAYRYFPTLAQQLTNLAVGVNWQWYEKLRTQATRQYGRGD